MVHFADLQFNLTQLGLEQTESHILAAAQQLMRSCLMQDSHFEPETGLPTTVTLQSTNPARMTVVATEVRRQVAPAGRRR